MKKFIKNHSKFFELFCLSLLLIFGAFLYSFKINSNPPALSDDEVSMGYNAYSISQTGRDEFGKDHPISFRLFQPAYGPPLLVYSTAAIISLNGFNPLSIRLMSIISGVLSIAVVFYFIRSLYFIKSLNIIKSPQTPYVGALIYTITPWAVLYSRSGYEAMLPFFLYILGILFIWLGFKKPYLLMIGLIILSLSIYTGVVNKFLIPLTIVAVALFFHHIVFKKDNRLFFLGGVLTAVIVQIPNFMLLNSPAFMVKNQLFYGDIVITEYAKLHTFIPGFIMVPYLFLREFAAQFFNYFSLRSLFFDPDPFPPRSIPELSVFYPWMVIPYLIGLFILWQKRKDAGSKFIILVAIISVIPVSLTKDPFWTYRALPLLFPLIIIIIIGLDKLISLKSLIPKIFIALLLLFSLTTLWRSYFILLPVERAKDFGVGFNKLAEYINKNSSTKYVVDNARNPLTYLHLATYMLLSPQQLQVSADPEIKNHYYNNTKADPNRSFANVQVRGIDWQHDIYISQILVGDDLAISQKQVSEHGLKKAFEIKDPLDHIVFAGYQTDPHQACLNYNLVSSVKTDCSKYQTTQ